MLLNFMHNSVPYIQYSTEEAKAAGVPQSVIDAAIADQQWADIRTQRDALLRASDYAVMPDYPLADGQLDAIKQYRQALRDIPADFDTSESVEWPAKPEVLA